MDETRLVERLAGRKVAVIGDVMLDHYVLGAVDRISPEAPVPVLRVVEERQVLGGAGNVAANLAALGGEVRLVAAIGSDAAGRQVSAMLGGLAGVDPDLVVSAARPTILKTRYICGQQQIVRVDRESGDALEDASMRSLVEDARAAGESCDCLILSDYGKGVLSDAVIAAAIEGAKSRGARIIVDPKRRDLGAYRGADFITPNRKELSDAVGVSPIDDDALALEAANLAIARSGASILLTRSERGMSLYRADAAPLHMAAEAREVFDVSGAGDTVVAGFGLALAAGLPVEDAMRIANAAAGVVVGKLGTATCSAAELISALQRGRGRADDLGAGATALEGAIAVRASWAAAGLKVGFANGCFDLLHPGHVSLLRQAAAACDRLIVAINSDASVKRLKGETRPVQNEAARAEVLMGIKGVDLVIVFDEPTPLEAVTALQPDLIVKGADYQEHEVVGADIVKARGGRVLLVPLEAGHSTSSMVARASGG